ncbi:MAG: hypothetical protein HYV77_00115 [Candidatus Wildermuthbacteria bacterium]|nr:hypothetical protein [Candidatus Wildermuthbacteria bacterium]
MVFPYQKISFQILSDVNPRMRDILTKRFGLETGEPLTLEAIGQEHNITRERVRQIVEDGLSQLRDQAARDQRKNPGVGKVLSYLGEELRRFGNIKREDLFVEEMGAEDDATHISFLLHLSDRFYRHRETEDFYSFWAAKKEFLEHAPKVHEHVVGHFEICKNLLSEKEIKEDLVPKVQEYNFAPKTFFSFLETSKHVMRAHDGRWGLRVWPEVNPKGVREKAYIVLKNTQKPLHFTEITQLIQELQRSLPHNPERTILSQTVHNELIKDQRFVLVGRGIYALSDWGYQPGTVREVLVSILQEAREPISKEEIINKILEQRQVKESTVMLNLQDRKMFLKDAEGNYYVNP